MRRAIPGFLALVLLVVACGGGNGDDEKEETQVKPGPAVITGDGPAGESL